MAVYEALRNTRKSRNNAQPLKIFVAKAKEKKRWQKKLGFRDAGNGAGIGAFRMRNYVSHKEANVVAASGSSSHVEDTRGRLACIRRTAAGYLP